MLKNGADPQSASISEQTPLDLLTLHAKASELISRFPIETLSSQTFLSLLKKREINSLEILIEEGFDIIHTDNNQQGYLHHILDSIKDRSALPIVKWLVEHGAIDICLDRIFNLLTVSFSLLSKIGYYA